MLVRSAVSAYEVPSAALAAELTADYDERTRVQAYRYLFGWGGGLAIMLAAYTLFLVPSPGHPNGLLNPLGYRAYALCGAIVMAVAILISAIGTHREIGTLPRASELKGRLKDNFRELGQTARNRAFLVLMAASVCAYTNQGVAFALSNYNYGYVWRLKGPDFIAVIVALMFGAIIAFVIAPRIAKGGGQTQADRAVDRARGDRDDHALFASFRGGLSNFGDRRVLPLLSRFRGIGSRTRRRCLHHRRIDDGPTSSRIRRSRPAVVPKACSSRAPSSSRNARRVSASSARVRSSRSRAFPNTPNPKPCRSLRSIV